MTLFIAILAFGFGLLVGNAFPQKGVIKRKFPRTTPRREADDKEEFNKDVDIK